MLQPDPATLLDSATLLPDAAMLLDAATLLPAVARLLPDSVNGPTTLLADDHVTNHENQCTNPDNCKQTRLI